MYAAVEALCDRKFGKGGPHNADTPGAWTESALVRSSAQVHDERFRECVSVQAQYLDLDFYDQRLRPGSYLETYARHVETWH